jgi:hypothetical protein
VPTGGISRSIQPVPVAMTASPIAVYSRPQAMKISVPTPLIRIATFGSKPISNGASTVAPNIATTCWMPSAKVCGAGSRSSGAITPSRFTVQRGKSAVLIGRLLLLSERRRAGQPSALPRPAGAARLR